MNNLPVSRSQKWVSLILLVSLVLGQFAVISVTPAAATSASPTQTKPEKENLAEAVLFRTRVVLRQPNDLARLEEMGVVVLDSGAEWALLLVTSDQLESVARLRFQPQATDALDSLARSPEAPAWLDAGLQPILAQAAARQKQVKAGLVENETAAAEMVAILNTITTEQRAALTSLSSIDDDGDGLTNLEEIWWCTDLLNPNSDGDVAGYTDGEEVAALLDVTLSRTVRWGYGPPFGPPNAWPDFNGSDGDPNTPACNDGDFDTIPDYAEAYIVGSRTPGESTDGDKFDDGQELFGITYCPGAPTNCGYGSYPAGEYWNYIQATMPNWVEPPGDNLFVAAFPIPEVSVVPGSWKVDRVTTITTQQGQMTQATNTYETSVTDGQSTSIANTETWNDWEEVSEAVETPLNGYNRVNTTNVINAVESCSGKGFWCYAFGTTKLIGGVAAVPIGAILAAGGAATCAETFGLGCAVAIGGGTLAMNFGPSIAQSGLDDLFGKDETQNTSDVNVYNQNTNIASADASASVTLVNNIDTQGIVNSLDGVQYAINQQGQLLARGLYDISYQLSRPRYTETRTNGRSWGGSQTTTNEVYEEHSISQGEAFTTGQNWSTAWAVDSSHAADLTFNYTIENTGTEYAREITGLIFNIYLGDDPTPLISYPAWQQFPNGKIENIFPGDKVNFASTAIPLTLEQMKRIDLGEKLTVVLEDFSYGADELFYQNAAAGGVTFFIEDGVEDGDETVDMYVIPTWGVETVQDVMGRYFPLGTDVDGNINSLWTPEFNGTGDPAWNEHFLSDIAWWNIYLTQPNAGNTPLNQLPAAADSALLFRFNRDSDRDGYQDRVEWKYYCGRAATDPLYTYCPDGYLRPEIHPQPEIIAGYTTSRVGNEVTVLLSIANLGTFDAYGIDAVMYAPDDTTTIGNNTVGGNGRVRPGQQVSVGSLVLPPDLTNWNNSAANVYAAGDFTGSADKTITFTVNTPGVVGSGSTALDWTDGGGITGTLALGSSYQAPLPVDVVDGIQVGFDTGAIISGDTFAVPALTPRDTFTFTVNSDPYTPPVIVVSYSDPQGSHRFVTPVELSSLEEDLTPYSGQMLRDAELMIATQTPVAAGVTNTVNFVFNNPHPATIENAHLYLNFVADGQLVAELPYTMTLPTGPTTYAVDWSTDVFSQTFDANADNILIAFWTDAQDNIIDADARPLPTFQDDPQAIFATDGTALTWDFGAVKQGTLLQKQFALGSVGFMDLLTYIGDAPGISLQGPASAPVSPADMAVYTMTINTASLPVGPFSQAIPIRTSDPQDPARTVTIQGTILAFATDSPPAGTVRPLDWPVTVPGPQSQGSWYTFNHTLGPTPQTLHPVKAYSQDYGTLWGVGKYATDFGQGTASYDMFGIVTDADLVVNSPITYAPSMSALATGTYVANQNTITLNNAAGFNQGHEVLIIQMQGTGAGNYEFHRIESVNGNQLTLSKPLALTYVQSGSQKVQAYRVSNYQNMTISSTGSISAPTWNGSVGGIIAFRVRGNFDVSTGALIKANGVGYTGGTGGQYNGSIRAQGYQGESYPNVGTGTTNANAGGGGGGQGDDGSRNMGAGGGGGGYGLNGSSGNSAGSPASQGGAGGGVYGSSDLSNLLFLGSGGGGGGSDDTDRCWGGTGGRGGGIIFIAANGFSMNGSILVNGANGSRGATNACRTGAGGGGSGGSIYLIGSDISVGNNFIQSYGGVGAAGVSGGGNGGNGGVGRIRIEYCNTLTGTTNPAASTQKLDCYIVEQVETSPYTQGRLNLPETISDSQTYAVQYGRRLSTTGSGQQTATLRVPANAYAAATLDALISGVSGSVTLQVDIGSDGSWEWQTTQSISGAAELASIDLADAFNAYWAAQGYPTSGNLDVPVTVSLNQAGQVLLTNLQMTPAGSALRYARTPADSYASWLMNLTVGSSGSGPLTIAADVGDDGSVEWAWSGTASFPASLTTGDLATAVNAYLSGQSGEVDVPIRFYLAPFSSLTVNGVARTAVNQPDATLTANDIAFTNPAPTETDVLTVTATLRNNGAAASGGVTAAFFATAPGGSEWYIGSDFVPDIPAGGSAAAAISWDTRGYTGTVPVRVEIDPYNRVAESSEANNEASQNLTILSRPDLQAASWDLSDSEPVTGEMVTVTVNLLNGGQTASGTAVYALYDGNPNSGGTLLDSKTGSSLSGGGSGTVTLNWTPTAPGRYQLFLRLDENNSVSEFDEANNLLWQDVYVGLAGPILLDSGVTAGDPAYTSTVGYGYVDNGTADALINCGGSDPEDSLRRDPDGSVAYRFDYLQPSHFYHLDITLYECDGAGRQENILVDGNLIAGPEDLGDGQVHKLSLRLDPALYADRSIDAAITAPGIDGAVVAAVNLHDIDYRYADAGGSADPAYGSDDYGWLDGVANNAWGGLPYQSVRVDQNDNQVSYQFDNLDPAKRYNVLLTFWQGSGAARIQKVRIDGLETGVTVDSGDLQRHDEVIAVPAGSYAGDGSIVVSIIRLNASSGAMVNEIALEEETLVSSADCQAQTTPFFSQVYGSVLLAGANAPVGTVVQAINPRGDTVGCFTVTSDGLYGFMRIYGEDNSANPPIPGMRAGELVSFKVSGSPAVATPLFYWQDDKASHPVDLNASAMDGQFILLNPGWNWLSLQVEPPTPLVAQTFSSINGRYDRVLGETGIYDTNLPPVFNSLTEIHAGLGYMMRITGTASVNLLAEGIGQPSDTPIPLHQGWNWVGYLPTSTLPVATALQSIAGQYQLVLGQNGTYDPDLPIFSTLQDMSPGEGYMIYADTAVTLTYPSAAPLVTMPQPGAANSGPQTPYFTIVYGDVWLNGVPAPPGTLIEAVTPRGNVAGRFVVQRDGVLGFMSVYGEDGTAVPLIPGFREGEEIAWRVNGHTAAAAAPLFWQNDWQTRAIELDLVGYWFYLPVISR